MQDARAMLDALKEIRFGEQDGEITLLKPREWARPFFNGSNESEQRGAFQFGGEL